MRLGRNDNYTQNIKTMNTKNNLLALKAYLLFYEEILQTKILWALLNEIPMEAFANLLRNGFMLHKPTIFSDEIRFYFTIGEEVQPIYVIKF